MADQNQCAVTIVPRLRLRTRFCVHHQFACRFPSPPFAGGAWSVTIWSGLAPEGKGFVYDGVFMGSWIGFRKMDPSRRILEASTYVSSRRGLPGWNCFPLVVRTVFEISSNQKETTGNMHAHSRAHTHVRTYSHADLLGQMVAMGVHSAVCIHVSVNSVAHYNVNVYTCTLPSGSNVRNSSSPKPTLLARLISEWGGI